MIALIYLINCPQLNQTKFKTSLNLPKQTTADLHLTLATKRPQGNTDVNGIT